MIDAKDPTQTAMVSTQMKSDNDTDGDGVLNYLDLDSDGDTIPDSVEGTVLLPNNDGVLTTKTWFAR